jgi:hypothetical protein
MRICGMGLELAATCSHGDVAASIAFEFEPSPGKAHELPYLRHIVSTFNIAYAIKVNKIQHPPYAIFETLMMYNLRNMWLDAVGVFLGGGGCR